LIAFTHFLDFYILFSILGLYFYFRFHNAVVAVVVAAAAVVVVVVNVVVASHFHTKYIKFHRTLFVPIFPNHILAQKMYPYCVNFINILRTNFSCEHHLGSFFYIHVTIENDVHTKHVRLKC